MDFWFFFSYAHADDTEFLRRFYRDLNEEVRQLVGVPKEEISFLDRNSISHGATWDTTLETGLKNCRVFVPLYSSSYFESEYCGKEFAAFRERLHAHLTSQGSTVADPLILPVLWNPEENVLERLPTSIDKIQYTDDDLSNGYPSEYKAVGVSQLVRMGITPSSKYYDQYWDFIRKYANNVKLAANALQLTPAASLSPLETVKSIFSGTAAAASSATEGPRYVQFIFVAGKQPELQAAQRKNLQFYGQNGGSDWQPYFGAYSGNAAALASEVISALPNGSQYEEIEATSDLQTQLELAASQDKIVVLMVDTWTLRLQKYFQLVAPLDTYSSVNCITLIAWNDADNEALLFKNALEATVKGTFASKLVQKPPPPNFLFNTIKSYDTFKQELIKALTQAQSQIVETAKIKKDMQYLLVSTADDAVTNPLP
jgi:FxsC-like protein